MSTSLRERRRQMLRDEILETAQALIAKEGYAAMSMEVLAACVGISKPTLYNQFPTKEGLMVVMATQVLDRLFSVLDDDGSSGRSPLDRLSDLLRVGIQTQLDHHATSMQLWMPEIIHMLKKHKGPLEQIRKIDALVVNLVRQALASGEISPQLNETNVVRIFYALFMSPSLGQLSLVDLPNSDEMSEEIVAFFRRGVGLS